MFSLMPVYFSIAPLLCGFVFTLRGLHTNSTRTLPAATLHSHVSVQARLRSHAESYTFLS